jgi:uncharacterized membrane protein
MMRNRPVRRAIGFILNGVLLTVPIAIVLFIIYKVLVWLSLPVNSILYPGEDHPISLISITVLLGFLLVIGYAGSKLINEPLQRRFNKWLDKIPLYKSVTDIINAFVGSKKKFNRPVLVKLNKDLDIEMIGFVTDEDLQELGDIQGKVGVYFPMSYSFAGHLMVVPKEHVKPIDKNSVGVMKYIVSGGIVELDEEENDKK